MDQNQTEADRVAALRGYSILDTPAEPEFDVLVKEAAALMETPIALISLIDERRQWFKARVGLEVQETPRSVSFCTHAIVGDEVMIVPDASRDVRFMNNPLVIHDPSIRFYAGAILKDSDGHRLGTLCVIDRTARASVTPEKIEALKDLADKTIAVLEERRRKAIAASFTEPNANPA